MLQAYAAYYPDVALNHILTPKAITHLHDRQRSCIDGTLAFGYWAEAVPSQQFLSAADFAPLLKAIAVNEPGSLKITTPTLVIQGTADKTVPPAATDAVVRDLCANDDPVLYRAYPSATHDGVMMAAKSDTEAWVAARFTRAAEGSNCNAQPSAAARQ